MSSCAELTFQSSVRAGSAFVNTLKQRYHVDAGCFKWPKLSRHQTHGNFYQGIYNDYPFPCVCFISHSNISFFVQLVISFSGLAEHSNLFQSIQVSRKATKRISIGVVAIQLAFVPLPNRNCEALISFLKPRWGGVGGKWQRPKRWLGIPPNVNSKGLLAKNARNVHRGKWWQFLGFR